MTTRHDLEPIVSEWLHSTLDAIPEPIHRYPLIAANVNQARQDRRWLPSINARRFETVLHATRFIVAGLTVAMLSGFLLVAILSERRGDEPSLVGTSPSPSVEASASASLTPEPAGADDIIVAKDGSGEHTSIARAIGAARDGDTIRVRPGRYEEQLDITKAIAVVGDGPRDEVVIVAVGDWFEMAGDRRNAAVEVRGANARVADLTILDERETGYGPPPSEIALSGPAEPVVERVRVEQIHIGERNRAAVRDNDVDAILALAADSPTIEGNRAGRVDIDGNADDYGAPAETALVVDNVVREGIRLVGFGHLVGGNRVGQIVDQSQGSLIRGNEVRSIELTGLDTVVRENAVSGGDHGIVIEAPAAGVAVEDNEVSGRSLGIGVSGEGPATISDNVVHGSHVGLLVATTGARISGNRICDNDDDVVRTWDAQLDLGANDICQAGGRVAGDFDADAIEGALEPGPYGFLFEELAPGLTRFVHDGAGHMVRAKWIFGPRYVQ